jgi:hypothetical protein
VGVRIKAAFAVIPAVRNPVIAASIIREIFKSLDIFALLNMNIPH